MINNIPESRLLVQHPYSFTVRIIVIELWLDLGFLENKVHQKMSKYGIDDQVKDISAKLPCSNFTILHL